MIVMSDDAKMFQMLALDYAEEEEDFVGFWIVVMSDVGKMFQLLALD